MKKRGDEPIRPEESKESCQLSVNLHSELGHGTVIRHLKYKVKYIANSIPSMLPS
jgi:hypothetical protein